MLYNVCILLTLETMAEIANDESSGENPSKHLPIHAIQRMLEDDLLYLLQEFWDFSLYHGGLLGPSLSLNSYYLVLPIALWAILWLCASAAGVPEALMSHTHTSWGPGRNYVRHPHRTFHLCQSGSLADRGRTTF